MRACTACLFERRWESLGKSPPKVSKRAKSPPKVCPKCVQREGQEKRKKREGAPAKEIHKQRARPEQNTEGTAGACGAVMDSPASKQLKSWHSCVARALAADEDADEVPGEDPGEDPSASASGDANLRRLFGSCWY